MVEIPEKYRKFAREYFNIAKEDLSRAKLHYNYKDYPMVVFFCQQAVEKAVKALMETKLYYVREHNVLPHFVMIFQNEWNKDFDFIVEALGFFEMDWIKTRYPVLAEDVKNPKELYDENKAKKSLEYAEKVLKIVEKYLKEKNVI